MGALFVLGQTAVTATSAFSTEQLEAIKTNATAVGSSVLDTFIDMLPVIALVAGIGFGISFVMGQINRVRNGN